MASTLGTSSFRNFTAVKERKGDRSIILLTGPLFLCWVMKFDGITSSTDTEVTTPKGYSKIKYAYHLMAVEAGIEMTTCRLHHEGGRSHFMTKRFDRSANGRKLHMQSWGLLLTMITGNLRAIRTSRRSKSFEDLDSI